MTIKHLNKTEVLSIYSEIIKKFGKEKGIVDEGNLESLLCRVEGYSAKNDKETIFWKAAIFPGGGLSRHRAPGGEIRKSPVTTVTTSGLTCWYSHRDRASPRRNRTGPNSPLSSGPSTGSF